jgi:hypothetical protein
VLDPRQAETFARPKWQHKQRQSIARRAPAGHRDAGAGSGRRLVCVRCGHAITSDDQAMTVEGLHEYTQVNPGGFVWNFRCFASAPGCAARGAPSSDFTWFAGHAWQIQHCAGCDIHMGWRFSSPAGVFYGLITERLVEAP